MIDAPPTRRVRVLVVDDSAVVRTVLSRGLSADPGIEVVGTACDPYAAREALLALRPDVMTLDIEMPRMDGVSFLRRLMPQWPIPTVMVSTLTVHGGTRTIEALDAGAVDFVAKPADPGHREVAAMLLELRAKVKSAAQADLSGWRERTRTRPLQTVVRVPPPAPDRVRAPDAPRLIAIAASTGGVEALQEVLGGLAPDMPPIVVVQHMPATFTGILATWLSSRGRLTVREARHDEPLEDGVAYIAPGGVHLRVRRRGGALHAALDAETAEVSGHRPSADVLFASVAQALGRQALGVLLTGMGRDGADGLLAMRQAGARTAAQDEATSLIYGMPRAAVACGAVGTSLALTQVGPWLTGATWEQP